MEHKPVHILSLGIVAYNEQEYLPQLLGALCAQDIAHDQLELVLVNSASTDGTRAIMEAFSQLNDQCTADEGYGFAAVRVVDNPRKIQAAGWNVAINTFTGDALVRVDAHASIPPTFASAVLTVLNEGEDVCGGMRPTMIAPGEETPWRETLYVAEESAFGSSVADYRRTCEPRYVDSLFHAAYRREVLQAVGPFNEQLLRTEDNDFHYRVRQAGYRIKLDPRIESCQFIRSSLRGMLKQKYGNGYWVGRTVYVQPKCLEVYHFAPFALVAGALAVTGVGVARSWAPFKVCATAYGALCVALSVYAAKGAGEELRNPTMIALPAVFAGIHISYGLGTLKGLVDGLFEAKQ